MAGDLICTACGASNTPGDQFCGSCGAFLEWQQPSTAAASTTGPQAAAAPPVPAPPTAAAPPVPAPPAAAATPVPAPPARSFAPPSGSSPSGDQAGAGVICPACQTLNPGSRSFCQRCGAALAAGPRQPATEPLRVPPPQAGPAETGRRGLTVWLPVVIGLGALIGLVVGGAVLMGPRDGPAALATVGPAGSSPTESAALATTPAAAAGPTSAGSPSAGPTTAVSRELALTAATASSVVGNREMFRADKVIDGRLDTSWQEGAREERGQWIEVTFAPAAVDYLVIHSGYQLSRDAYLANRRPREVLVSVEGAAPAPFQLADQEAPQRLRVEGPAGATRVRLEIVSTYDPQATAYPGSPFDDMAISEILVFGFPDG